MAFGFGAVCGRGRDSTAVSVQRDQWTVNEGWYASGGTGDAGMETVTMRYVQESIWRQ